MLDKSYFCMSRKRLNNTLHYNLTPTFAMSENLLISVTFKQNKFSSNIANIEKNKPRRKKF